jgi:Ca2+-transporting ATPase
MLMTTVGISALTQLALVYVPFLQAVFQTEALGRRDMGVIMSIAGSSFGLHEVRRRWERSEEDKGGYESVAMEELA